MKRSKQMELYEPVIEILLTVIEKCFVLPQAPSKVDSWEAYPDFVALDFTNKRILVVEVTKRSSLSDVRKTLGDKLKQDYRAKVDEWIKMNLPDPINSYPVIRRFFVRDRIASKLKDEPEWRDHVKRGHVKLESLEGAINQYRETMP